MFNAEKEILVTIEQCEENIRAGEALKRLDANPDFRLIVHDLYMRKNAVRLVHALGDPNCASDEVRERLVREMDSIASFSAFLRQLEQAAHQAEVTKQANETELELLRGEV